MITYFLLPQQLQIVHMVIFLSKGFFCSLRAIIACDTSSLMFIKLILGPVRVLNSWRC